MKNKCGEKEKHKNEMKTENNPSIKDAGRFSDPMAGWIKASWSAAGVSNGGVSGRRMS